MEVHLLGPIEATHGDTPVALGSPRQRAVLAMLALAMPETVSTDRLIDGLWGDEPPKAPLPTLQVFISGLRKALHGTDAEIVRAGAGYRLTGSDTDLAEVTRLRAIGTLEALGNAGRIWRGDSLAGLRDTPFAEVETGRLDELRLTVAEEWFEARLRAGGHADLVSELEGFVRNQPMRERAWGLLMTALYRADRQADALAAYGRARDHLAEELGVDPSQALQALELAILRQDPSIQAPNRPTTGRAGRSPPDRLPRLPR